MSDSQPPKPRRTKEQEKLFRRCLRLVNRAEELGHTFTELEHGAFGALGQVEWDETRVHVVVMKQLDLTEQRLIAAVKRRRAKS